MRPVMAVYHRHLTFVYKILYIKFLCRRGHEQMKNLMWISA